MPRRRFVAGHERAATEGGGDGGGLAMKLSQTNGDGG